MHSRKSQSQRTRVAEQFRKGTDLIMFSSDVSARGMDYPDVTHVVQARALARSPDGGGVSAVLAGTLDGSRVCVSLSSVLLKGNRPAKHFPCDAWLPHG
eukprot:6174593-Pleurochrysis_carterae.AAC.1